MSSYFEIQHYTLLEGWVNTWSDEAGRPIRFDNRLSAEREVREFFVDLEGEVRAGNIQPYALSEFRIVKVWSV